MWIALLAWSPPPKNLQKSVIGEAYKIGPSFIAVPMMMSGSLYKEIGGMATGQEGVAMVRVWHQGWIFGVIKVYIVLVAFLFYWPFCHWPFWFLAFLKIGQISLAFWHSGLFGLWPNDTEIGENSNYEFFLIMLVNCAFFPTVQELADRHLPAYKHFLDAGIRIGR